MASEEETQQRIPSQQRRRRPRKLKRNTSEPVLDVPAVVTSDDGLVKRVETLDTRIKKVESQLSVIRARSSEPPAAAAKEKSRSRRRKQPTVQPTVQTAVQTESKPVKDIGKVGDQRTTDNGQNKENEPEEDVEEIVRTDDQPDHQGRAPVSVVGSYRLPLPHSVSEKDVIAITKGLSSVTNIARQVIATAHATGDNSTRPGYARTQSGSGWSSWFGSYSASMTRVINNIAVEASVESSAQSESRRPVVRKVVHEIEVSPRRPRKLKLRSDAEIDIPSDLAPTSGESLSR